ncbi:MAG TPA: DUF72 domain-containing protein [Solirubrobacterales bacterium]|nr:DUF72 domain-containing protein [Solirubrobacterales bacterium]
MAKRVHIGCSGWNYRDWRGVIYPEKLPTKRWLERYAELFDTVEVNNTFYRLPSPSAVEGWVEQTPRGFRFSVKASRYLTHVKRLRDMRPGVRRYFAAVKPLADSPKMGPVLWQLPANFRRDEERLAAALEQLPKGRHCFEFRHESWFCPEVYDLLRRHRAALVIGDDPERPFQTHQMTATWTYIRFHRGNRGRRGNYSDRELDEWGRRIAAWRTDVEVYAYFNNDWEGFAPQNARWLAERLSD